MRFLDREEAGRQLAQLLGGYRHEDVVVLGLPRGGIPVANQVATALSAPLDVWVVRKVGAPGHAEFGIGAVAEGGIVYLNPETLRDLGLSASDFRAVVQEKSEEVAHRVRLFRGGRSGPSLQGRTVILVDDGIATGGTIRAAIQSLRVAGPRRIVLAVPVAATQSLDELSPLVDEVVCLHSTPELYAIGAWYDDFEQVPDREVIRLLEGSRLRQPTAETEEAAAAFTPRELSIPIEEAQLEGILTGPSSPRGLVLFAHGSGSSRLSPRNSQVAAMLHHFGLATLLFDLLTRDEELYDQETAELRFDIQLLAGRLVAVTDWASSAPVTRDLPVGYFGSSTGAAAALVAAARRPGEVRAVVCRGGRPELAWDSLPEVHAPTLLIVGGEDQAVLELNQRAYRHLQAPKQLVVVPGATHLFEEPGALDQVSRLAGQWFREQLIHQTEEPGLGVS